MKVLHVTEVAKAGVGSYLNDIIPVQRHKYGDQNIHLLAPQEHIKHLTKIEPSSIHFFTRRSRKSGILKLLIEYIRVMRKERPDIVHVHATFSGAIVRMLRPFFPRTPIIYCPHGWAMDMEQSSLSKVIIRMVEWILSFFCEKIVCISKYERQLAIDAGISQTKCITIYNGITPNPPAFSPITWEDDTRLKVLFIGRFDRQKGVDILLNACSPLENKISLKLIGETVSGDENIDLNTFSFAEHLGWLEHSEIAAWLDQCDVLIVPSRWEGYGLVAIEAMRMGRPVIASKVGGLSEIIEDGVSGLYIKPNDIISLRNAIKSLDKETAAIMGGSARKRFLALFQSKPMHDQIMSLYQDITNR